MERWEIVRARIAAQVERKTYQGEWEPERPWSTVMSHTAYSSGLDSSWWFNKVDKLWISGGSPTTLHWVVEGAPTKGSAQEPSRARWSQENDLVQIADSWRRLLTRNARTGDTASFPADAASHHAASSLHPAFFKWVTRSSKDPDKHIVEWLTIGGPVLHCKARQAWEPFPSTCGCGRVGGIRSDWQPPVVYTQ